MSCVAVLIYTCIGYPEGAPFPGDHAALACLAAALLCATLHIFSGCNYLAWLRLSPVTYIGKVSYGFYLWHWPPLVFFYMLVGAPADPLYATLLMVAAFLVSIASFHFLETPIRQRLLFSRPGNIVLFVASGSVLAIVIGILLVTSGGLIFLYPKPIQQFLAAPGQRGVARCGKVHVALNPSSEMCPLHTSRELGGVLILGDSHADVLKEMIADAASTVGSNVHLTVRNCSLGRFGSDRFCSRDVLRSVLDEAGSLGVRRVIAISHWESDKFSADSMANDIAEIVRRDMRVSIMRRVPEHDSYDPRDRAKRALIGEPLDHSGIATELYIEQNVAVDAMIDDAASRFASGSVEVFSPSGVLCPGDTCRYHSNGTPLYIDTNHLSFTGAKLLQEMFEERIGLSS